MAEYRLCCVDGEGRVARTELIEAATDNEAIRSALELNRAAQCELWQEERFVASIGANKCSGAKSYRFEYES